MSDAQQGAANKARWIFWCYLCLFLVVAYLLSPGPLIWCIELVNDDPSTELKRMVRGFYYPILYAMKQVHWIDQVYTWYFDLWGVR